MKKAIIIIAIVVCALLVCGCVKKPVESGDAGIDEVPTATVEPEATGEVDGLDQADLDKLKEDLEKLEYEDLGGLSGE